MNVITVKSTKKGFKVVKIKVAKNEQYLIMNESGDQFNKLKFVKKNKNLEEDGQEQQLAVLENYYAPNMNASIVNIDGVVISDIGYIVGENSGDSSIESSEAEISGFSVLGLGVAAVAIGAGVAIASNSSNSSSKSSSVDAGALTPEQIKGLCNNLSFLSAEALGVLTKEQSEVITDSQLDSFDATDIKALSPEAITGLTITAIGSLDATQVGALTPEQWNGNLISDTEFNISTLK